MTEALGRDRPAPVTEAAGWDRLGPVMTGEAGPGTGPTGIIMFSCHFSNVMGRRGWLSFYELCVCSVGVVDSEQLHQVTCFADLRELDITEVKVREAIDVYCARLLGWVSGSCVAECGAE